MSVATTSPPQARLGRYALWHLRDYLRDKGIATLITLALVGYLTQIPIMRARASGFGGAMMEQIADQAFISALKFLGFVGVLFATNGIVADDRRHGYFRLLFAKPVSVVDYYAQKWAVYGLGFLIVAALLLGLYGVTIEPFFPISFLPTFALIYVALGGIGFLLSAAWRFDWLSLAAVLGVSDILWLLFRDEPGLAASLVRLLPPVHLLDGVYRAVREGGNPPVDDVVWLGAYGLACFVGGLLVVRRRPLAGQ
ncbi:MAG: ABC transporter permease [Gemmatimonadota bacterium]|nr:ABC transporter permease [Gemmatimonadota bacterium]